MNAAIIVASGKGQRMQSSIPKQFLKLRGKAILLRTLEVFIKHQDVDLIVLVISKDMEKDYFEQIKPFLDSQKPIKIVYGGGERYESVDEGLKALPKDTDFVLIHDGVRPFVKADEIDKVLAKAKEKGAAILAKSVTDTIKMAKDKQIINTLEREFLYAAMTPQVFKYDIIMKAYDKLKIDNKMFMVTDDAMVVERFVQEVYIVVGGQENIKITNPIDLTLGLSILDSRGEI